MLGHPVSQTLLGNQLQMLAQSHLDQARVQKAMQHVEMALVLYDQAKVTFKHAADAYQLIPPLSEVKNAFSQARTPQTAEAQALRQRIAEVYFERAQLLEKLGKGGKAQASYQKAQAWGHLDVAAHLNRRLAEAALHSAALTGHSVATVRSGGILPSFAQQAISNSSSPIFAETPSILFEPAKNPESPLYLDTGVEEKNRLVNQLFKKVLQTFKEMQLRSVLPSVFLVYAHDNPHYGTADAGTSKFLIHQLFGLGVNMYSDQTPKGRQAQASFSTLQDAARTDDILTNQLCLLPTAIGSIQPVDKVIVCSSQVLGHYLQWQHYAAFCTELKAAYGLGQQNTSEAEAQIRQVVNTYVKYPGFHHVLTEMAFLKIRTEYLEQHGIIPVSLSADGYISCCEDFIHATTVRIEDMPRFASQQASGQQVYENQGRHLVFFKVLERLLARNDAEALLRVFWTGYADLIQRLNSQAAVPQIADYLPEWDRLFESVRATLQTLKEQVGAHELQTALTRYASLDRLAIQRLSGPPLSMKDCYINLAIVEHERARKEEKKPKEVEENARKEKEVASSHFHRLPSAEAMDSNTQKLVPLEQLFEPLKVSDDKTVIPKRILIRGRAGVGKTTLSKKIVYEYTQKGQWRDHFDYLLWIPLRALKGKQSCDWVTLFHETYFQSHLQGLALAGKLAAQINGVAKEKTLFVLDGWDEIAQEWGEHEPMSRFLKQLLNQPAVLITSRPYVELKQADPMDLELETVGFSPENVTAYLDNPAMMPVSQAQQIKQFIQANPFIQGLVNVPIQLDALCYSWDEIKCLQAAGAITVTELYQAMMNKLWRKDILALGKREGGKLLSAEAVHALRSASRIEQAVKAEHDFLGALAFQGLQDNRIEFDTSYVDHLIEQLAHGGVPLPLTLENHLKKLSFLHTEDAQRGQSSYHFMHLSFQEFLAAKHFVQHWNARREITLLSADTQQWQQASPDAFVRRHKYNPRYEIFWLFVSGLLQGEALNRFFTLLEAQPRDLFGAAHHRLIMDVLYEASRIPGMELAPATRDRLEQDLGKLLRLEIDQTGEGTLAFVPTFPEHVLIQCLKVAAPVKTKIAVARALGYRSALSTSALKALIALISDPDWQVKRLAAELLGKQSSLPASAVEAFIALMKDSDSQVKRNAAEVLGKQSSLPASAVEALIALTKDSDREARYRAAEVLGKQSSLPASALKALIALRNDSDWLMRDSAADALGKQFSLPASALKALIALAKDSDRGVKRRAAEVLGKPSLLPSSALEALIVLTKESDWHVERRAAEVLGQQSSLPSSALEALIALMKHPDREVERLAAEVLGQQSSLPASALEALIELMKHPDREVEFLAAEVLGKQSSLPALSLEALIVLTRDSDRKVKRSAVYVLGKQSSLPSSALEALIALTKDLDHEVMHRAADVLGKQSSLPPSALDALIALTKAPYKKVQLCAAAVLGKQSSLPASALEALIALMKNQDREVTRRAAEILGKQSSLPASALEALIVLTMGSDWHVKRRAAEVLGKQSSLPASALEALIALMKHPDREVTRRAAEVLGKQSSLPASALKALIALIKDPDKKVQCSAAEVLGRQSSLPASALVALIVLTRDFDSWVKCSAAEVLGKQSLLPASALKALIVLTRDSDSEVKRRAAEVLGQQYPLPASALKVLIALIKDPDKKAQRSAAEVLGRQSSLPASALKALIVLTKDLDSEVKRSAVEALGRQSSLPASALKALIVLTKDLDSWVKYSAAEVLGKQSSLPASALKALIVLTRDSDSEVKRSAVEVLGKQSSLSALALETLIALMKEPVKEMQLCVAEVLGKQSSLPSSALEALIALMKDQDLQVKYRAAEMLAKHLWALYRLLPTLNRQQIELIYTEYLLKQRFDQGVPFYIQEGSLYFYTAQRLQSVPFSDANQEVKFKQAVQQAQQAAGLPLALRDQSVQPGAQNEEEMQLAPSISQMRGGPIKRKRSTEIEVSSSVASGGQSASSHLSIRKKVLGFIKVNAK